MAAVVNGRPRSCLAWLEVGADAVESSKQGSYHQSIRGEKSEKSKMVFLSCADRTETAGLDSDGLARTVTQANTCCLGLSSAGLSLLAMALYISDGCACADWIGRY